MGQQALKTSLLRWHCVLQTVPFDRAAAVVTSVVHEMLPRSIDRRISGASGACSPSSHWVDCIFGSGKIVLSHGPRRRGSNPHLGTDNLGALERRAVRLAQPSTVHRACTHSLASPTSQHRNINIELDSDHRQQLTSGVAGRNSTLTHPWSCC
jgi:hypothetical protein